MGRTSTGLPEDPGRVMVTVPTATHARMVTLKSQTGIPFSEMVKRAMEVYLSQWD